MKIVTQWPNGVLVPEVCTLDRWKVRVAYVVWASSPSVKWIEWPQLGEIPPERIPRNGWKRRIWARVEQSIPRLSQETSAVVNWHTYNWQSCILSFWLSYCLNITFMSYIVYIKISIKKAMLEAFAIFFIYVKALCTLLIYTSGLVNFSILYYVR